ncbi:MAG: 2-amino-4-hydroxy-6-hydroxymethyldihydropteridine diphosphokinase [Acidobacteriota bacterium]
MRYFLSLGSNLGKKRRNLSRALNSLEEAGIEVVRASSIYRTQPVDFAGQPWFYNQVVEVEAPFAPPELLDIVQRIEKGQGRRRTRRKGPRPIDIDILLAENRVIATKRLVIPHPRMAGRNFVLVPLAEIASHTAHPVLKRKVSELKKKSTDPSAVKKLSRRGTRA